MNQTTRLFVKLTVATATLALAAGCKSGAKKDSDAFQDPFFPPQGNVPASKTMYQKQVALGAAEDGMLFPIHFTGEHLNSLGKQKVDAIVAGTPADEKPKIFINVVKDDAMTGPRQANVETYLHDSNLPTDGYMLAVGPNPLSLQEAAAGVAALNAHHLEQGDASGSGTSNNLPVSRDK